MEKENQPQQIQISLDPNAYAISNVSMASDEEIFHFMITSGNQGRQFTATPKHAKRIYLLLKQQIENYEGKFGEIKTELPKISVSATQQNTTVEPKVGF